MERIFYKKWTATLFIAAILVLVLLLCALLVTLTQMSALKQRTEELVRLIDAARNDEQSLQDFLDFRTKNEYVIKWAEEHGYLKASDIEWLADHA